MLSAIAKSIRFLAVSDIHNSGMGGGTSKETHR